MSLKLVRSPSIERMFPDLPVGMKVGQWELKGYVTQGGQGEIHQAKHIQTGQTAALKLFDAKSPGERKIIRSEAKLLKNLAKWNAIGVPDFYEYGIYQKGAMQIAYFAMEFVEGLDLSKVRTGLYDRTEANLDFSQALSVLIGLNKALCSINDSLPNGAQPVVHGDLKEENILLSNEGLVKLIDFYYEGCSRSKQLTIGEWVGSPYYQAPEVLEGEEFPSQRSDIFAMAVLMHRMITGRFPFTIEDTAWTWEAAVREIGRSQKRSDFPLDIFPQEFKDLGRAMSEKDPNNRPQSYQELLDDLEKLDMQRFSLRELYNLAK